MTPKVKVITPKSFRLYMTANKEDTEMVSRDYLYETMYGESNGGVTDEITRTKRQDQ